MSRRRGGIVIDVEFRFDWLWIIWHFFTEGNCCIEFCIDRIIVLGREKSREGERNPESLSCCSFLLRSTFSLHSRSSQHLSHVSAAP